MLSNQEKATACSAADRPKPADVVACAPNRSSKQRSAISGLGAYFFFNPQTNKNIPESYERLWHQTPGNSNLRRVKALLVDYTKDNSVLGPFLGRFISGHWNRHHIDAVSQILKQRYDSVEHLVFDLQAIKQAQGGSLDRRISFIVGKLAEQKTYSF